MSPEESKEFIGNPKYSFKKFLTTTIREDDVETETVNLYVITTTEKDLRTGQLDVLGNRAGYIDFDTDRGQEDGGNTFLFKLPDLLRSLQSTFRYAEEMGRLSDTYLTHHFKSNRKELAGHTLLLEENSLNEKYLNNTAEFEKKYLFSFEIVSTDKVKEAVENRDSKYAYFYISRQTSGYHTFVIEAGTGEVLWYTHDPYAPIDKKITPSYLKTMRLGKYAR